VALLLPYGGRSPSIHPEAFVAPNAVLIGDVRIGARASVWFGAVLRGDHPEHPILVGEDSNVQDGVVLHVGDWGPTVIERRVTIGHGAVLECCRIGEGSLVGMRAVVLQEAIVGPESLIAAGAVVLEGSEIPARSLVAGVPGRVRKTLDGSSAEWVSRSWAHYVELARSYRAQGLGEP
jgi:carbonic anhydrase/acetyltransferase-like protein (isoleucine patch superfamily)